LRAANDGFSRSRKTPDHNARAHRSAASKSPHWAICFAYASQPTPDRLCLSFHVLSADYAFTMAANMDLRLNIQKPNERRPGASSRLAQDGERIRDVSLSSCRQTRAAAIPTVNIGWGIAASMFPKQVERAPAQCRARAMRD